jgi:hypothetical protein
MQDALDKLRYIVRDLEYKISQQCPEAIVQASYDAFEDIRSYRE